MLRSVILNSRHSSVMPKSSEVPSSRCESTKACAVDADMCAGNQINIDNIYATSSGKDAMVYLIVDDLERIGGVFGIGIKEF